MSAFLIVGLGNPGREYEKTRHNIGFLAVDALAEKWDLQFQKKTKLKGKLAQKKGEKINFYLFKPDTYMNLSGLAVKAVIDYFNIDLDRLLVIVDDVAIPFGEFRLKKESGSGGHRGLENIEECLATQAYARLRIGVGEKKSEQLTAHVLGKFTSNELECLPTIKKKAIEVVELFFEKSLEYTQSVANVRQKKLDRNRE